MTARTSGPLSPLGERVRVSGAASRPRVLAPCGEGARFGTNPHPPWPPSPKPPPTRPGEGGGPAGRGEGWERGARGGEGSIQTRYVLLALLLCLPLPATAQPNGIGILDVALSPPEITVGDRIEAQLTLVWTGAEPAAEPRFPTWQEGWGDAEVLSSSPIETAGGLGGRRLYHQNLVLTAFTTGEIRLPEVTVALPLDEETIEIASAEHRFTVRSVLPEDREALKPRPPAPPVSLAAEAQFGWMVGGLGGLGLLLAWLLARRLRTFRPSVETAPVAPLAELLDRLRQLDPTAAEAAHTGLSLGLRDFLGRSLGFPAMESTTTEIERRLGRTRPPGGGQTTQLELETTGDAVRLLRDCDQVKFAGLTVAAPVTRERLRLARDLGRRIDHIMAAEADAEVDAEAAR